MRGRGLATLAVAVSAVLAPAELAHAECADADLHGGAAEHTPRMVEALFCLHNEERAKAGLPAFRWSTLLAQAATSHSNDMVQRGYFAHNSPEGKTPADRIRAAGYLDGAGDWSAGENIAWGNASAGTARSIMSKWMASQTHRKNVLDPEFRDLGFGVTLGSPGKGQPPEAVTYTVNLATRDAPDDETVRTGPSGPSVVPPKAPDEEKPAADPETGGGSESEPAAPGTEPDEPAAGSDKPAAGSDKPVASGESTTSAPPVSRTTESSSKRRKALLRKCLKKAKKKRARKARRRARSRCYKRHGRRGERRRSRSSPAT